MAEREQFTFGDINFPLEDGTPGVSLLATCDPARAKLISFLSAQLDRYIGEALTGSLSAGAPRATKNVARTLSVDPVANVVKAEQVGFPLFCIWPKSSTFDDKTSNWRQEIRILGVAYMLPKMTLEQAEKYEPILRSVVAVLNHSLYLGYDPNYNNGERVVGDNRITSAKLVRGTYEAFQIGDLTDTQSHAFFGEIELREMVQPNDVGLAPLTGANLKITDGTEQPGNPVDAINARL